MKLLSILLICVLVVALDVPSHSATQPPGRLEIGLLLIAIDVQPDHLRISEGLRIGNPGARQARSLDIPLPPGAAYLSFHNRPAAVRSTPDGVSARVEFPTGVTDIAYSYAVAVDRAAVLARTFPLVARRVEVVISGAGVRVTVRGGSGLPPVELGGRSLQRWEVRNLAAGSPLVIGLSDLPTRRSRVPLAAALGLAGVLAAALLLSLRPRTDPPSHSAT